MLCNGQKKRDIEKIDFSYCNKYKIPKCAIWKMKKSIFHIVTSIKYRNVLMYFFICNVTRETHQITPIKKNKFRS